MSGQCSEMRANCKWRWHSGSLSPRVLPREHRNFRETQNRRRENLRPSGWCQASPTSMAGRTMNSGRYLQRPQSITAFPPMLHIRDPNACQRLLAGDGCWGDQGTQGPEFEGEATRWELCTQRAWSTVSSGGFRSGYCTSQFRGRGQIPRQAGQRAGSRGGREGGRRTMLSTHTPPVWRCHPGD